MQKRGHHVSPGWHTLRAVKPYTSRRRNLGPRALKLCYEASYVTLSSARGLLLLTPSGRVRKVSQNAKALREALVEAGERCSDLLSDLLAEGWLSSWSFLPGKVTP
jgi:hypothetical protein